MAGEYKKAFQQSVEASKAEYRQLGKSGLRISVPVVGCMHYGDPSWQKWVLDEEKVSVIAEQAAECSYVVLADLFELQSLPLLKAAYDRGLNSWDTGKVFANMFNASG